MLFITIIPDVDPNKSDMYSWFGNYRHSDDCKLLIAATRLRNWLKLL